jgi:predicted AAA+ superfamily ATPase
MFPRLLVPPKSSFFLLGPRGSGKTTWLKHHFPKHPRFDLLDEARYQRYLQDIGAFERELRAVPEGSWVIIDEVQRLPALLNEVHRAIEDRRLRFSLTGSSARKLRRAGVNLLAGRALRCTMYPLSPEELGREFDLERALSLGTLPVVWTSETPEATLAAYVQLYLKEEIQGEALVRNLPGFARFLPIAGLCHGQLVNAAGIARDAGVARTTVLEYLSIQEDTLLAYRLPAFEGRLRVRERQHPKLFWVDAGIARAVSRSRGTLSPEERGRLFEGFVGMLMRLYMDLGKLDIDEIAYWSPAEATKTEVDFVLTRGKHRWAIEVKAAARVHEAHFSGLRAIADLAGLKRRVLVHPGDADARTADGIEVWRFERFCEALSTGTLLG